jgi:hypothetical protein
MFYIAYRADFLSGTRCNFLRIQDFAIFGALGYGIFLGVCPVLLTIYSNEHRIHQNVFLVKMQNVENVNYVKDCQ